MESEKPLPLRVFIGCVLTIASAFLAYVLRDTAFGQSMQQLPNLAALAMLVLGIFLMLTGFRKTSKTASSPLRTKS